MTTWYEVPERYGYKITPVESEVLVMWYCDYCKETHHEGQTCVKPDVKPFDVVRLKHHTSLYRAYSLPKNHPGGDFVFVCLYADEIRYMNEVEVIRKSKDPLNT